MRISIFGLGHVGMVSAAFFSHFGFNVVALDTDEEKTELLKKGKSPIFEPGIEHLISENVKNRQLITSNNTYNAAISTDISFVCVGTPSSKNGSPDLQFVKKVVKDISYALREKDDYHVICIRSTILPGTTEKIIIPLIEKCSYKKVGKTIGVVFNPEFLREGNALEDFLNPTRKIIGEYDIKCGDMVGAVYSRIKALEIRVDIKTAELIKYTDNAYHALKVSFANEIASLCDEQDIDSQELMKIFCLDTKLNISSAYLRPGQAFGGACLSKDVKALNYLARKLSISTPILNSINPSNEQQKKRIINQILSIGVKKIGILGLGYKFGIDDFRESPSVELIHSLIEYGNDVKIFDSFVSISNIIGENKKYIFDRIPNIKDLIIHDIDEFIQTSDIFVITQNNLDYQMILNRTKKRIIMYPGI